MGYTQTSLGFRKPNISESGWGEHLNYNMDLMDSIIAGMQAYTQAMAGMGVLYNGTENEYQLNPDDSTIEVDPSTEKVQIKDGGVTQAKLANESVGNSQVNTSSSSGLDSSGIPYDRAQPSEGSVKDKIDGLGSSSIDALTKRWFDVTAKNFYPLPLTGKNNIIFSHKHANEIPKDLSFTYTNDTLEMTGIAVLREVNSNVFSGAESEYLLEFYVIERDGTDVSSIKRLAIGKGTIYQPKVVWWNNYFHLFYLRRNTAYAMLNGDQSADTVEMCLQRISSDGILQDATPKTDFFSTGNMTDVPSINTKLTTERLYDVAVYGDGSNSEDRIGYVAVTYISSQTLPVFNTLNSSLVKGTQVTINDGSDNFIDARNVSISIGTVDTETLWGVFVSSAGAVNFGTVNNNTNSFSPYLMSTASVGSLDYRKNYCIYTGQTDAEFIVAYRDGVNIRGWKFNSTAGAMQKLDNGGDDDVIVNNASELFGLVHKSTNTAAILFADDTATDELYIQEFANDLSGSYTPLTVGQSFDSSVELASDIKYWASPLNSNEHYQFVTNQDQKSIKFYPVQWVLRANSGTTESSYKVREPAEVIITPFVNPKCTIKVTFVEGSESLSVPDVLTISDKELFYIELPTSPNYSTHSGIIELTATKVSISGFVQNTNKNRIIVLIKDSDKFGYDNVWCGKLYSDVSSNHLFTLER